MCTVIERVPWICKQEWEYCRDQLFGSDLLMKRRAVEHLYVWKARYPNLPIAVECTLILMEVHLNNEEEFTNTMSYESWYSMTIMRFLNLIMDSDLGNRNTSSMQELAVEYNIPRWIVEIRHSAAHGPSLPSLSSLKEAVEHCLQWLYESYWSKDIYDDTVPAEGDETSSSTFLCFEACLIVKRYLLYGMKRIANIPLEDREKIHRVLSKKADTETDYNFDDWPLEKVHKCMLKKLARHLKKDTKYGRFLISEILQSDRYLICADAMRNQEICRKFLNKWAEVLSVLCDSNVCVHLLQGLADIVISPMEDLWRRRCAAAYLNEILCEIASWRKQNYKLLRKSKKTKLHNKDENGGSRTLSLTDLKLTDQDVWRILNSVLKEPTPVVEVFLLNLFNVLETKVPESKRDQILELINIYNGKSGTGTGSIKTGDIHALLKLTEDPMDTKSILVGIQEELGQETQHMLDEPVTTKDEWSWNTTPLGILPWQTEFHPWLQIYSSEE